MPADQAQQYDVIGVRGVIGYYYEALEQLTGRNWVPKIANEFSSNQDTETYAGAGMVPQLREWIGGKQARAFTEMSVKITNKDWESTILIKNKDRRRDKTGQIAARMGDLATRALAHDAKLISNIINLGTGTTIATAYDGLAMFSASHKVGTQALNNIVSYSLSAAPIGTAIGTGTTTAPSVAVAALAIMAGIQQIYGYVDDQGEPINEMAQSFLIMAPVALSGVLQAAMTSVYAGLGYSNPLLSQQSPAETNIKLEVLANPRLTWTNQFAIFRTDGAFKPIISQLEVPPIVKALAEGSDFEFDNNAIKMSVEKSGNVGIGRFDQSVLVQLAA